MVWSRGGRWRKFSQESKVVIIMIQIRESEGLTDCRREELKL